MNYLVNKGIEGLDKTGDMIANAGTAVQNKLETTGISSGLTNLATQAADTTKALGSSIVQTGTAVAYTASENQYVAGLT
jgi:hypothetical protein